MRLAILGSIVVSVTLVPGVGLACGGNSDGGHNHGPSQHQAAVGAVAVEAQPLARHGGYVFASADLQFELAADQREVRVYAYGDRGEEIDLRGVNGVLRSAGGADSIDDAVVLTYKSEGLGRSGWLAANFPAREAPPAPGEYRIFLRNLPSRQVREMSIVWPPEALAAPPADTHSAHQH